MAVVTTNVETNKASTPRLMQPLFGPPHKKLICPRMAAFSVDKGSDRWCHGPRAYKETT